MVESEKKNGIRERLLKQLHRFEWSACLPALSESIRLLESDEFAELTQDHIREVSDYRAIRLGGQVYFERAFSPGKEAAMSLAAACLVGRELVLDDLTRLHSSVTGPDPS